MTTEEKAKKYDEALEWMRKLYPGLHGATKEDAEHYFPELRESEDEDETRRKWILEYLYDGLRKSDEQFKEQFKSAIAWLEKQKEQKPVTINQDEKEFLADEITTFLCNYDKEFDGEDPVPSEIAEHFYLLGKQAQEQKPVEWSKEDKAMIDDIIFSLPRMANGSIEILPSVAKSYSERLKSLRPQSKAEWSEEDKHIIGRLRSIVQRYAFSDNALDVNGEFCEGDYAKLDSWLKSLQPQAKQEQKPEAKLTGWVARDKECDSDAELGLVLFKGKPRRACNCWIGAVVKQLLTWDMFPDLKWEDEPMEVEITITKK